MCPRLPLATKDRPHLWRGTSLYGALAAPRMGIFNLQPNASRTPLKSSWAVKTGAHRILGCIKKINKFNLLGSNALNLMFILNISINTNYALFYCYLSQFLVKLPN
jgi:hypothetical protein